MPAGHLMDGPTTQCKGKGTLLQERRGEDDPAVAKERSQPHSPGKGRLPVQPDAVQPGKPAGWVTAGWAAGVGVRGDTLHLAARASSGSWRAQLIGNELWSLRRACSEQGKPGPASCHATGAGAGRILPPGCRRVQWLVRSVQATPRAAQDLLLFILSNFISPQVLVGGSPLRKAGTTREAGLSHFGAGPTETV